MTTPDATAALENLTRVAPELGPLNAAVLEALEQLHANHDGPAIEIDDAGVMHGERVHYIPTVRTQKLATPGIEGERHVEAIVWHYTDTRNAGAVNLAKRIAAAGASRSCHGWIDAAGVIAQSASFERGTWHAGSDTAALFARESQLQTWRMLTKAQRGQVRGWGANSFAAGIELENVGEVRRLGAQWLGWPFRHDHKDDEGKIVRPCIVPDHEVSDVIGGKHWHRFTDAQISSSIALTAALVARYGLTREMCQLTHSAIDPTRRTDPGELWVRAIMPQIIAHVFG